MEMLELQYMRADEEAEREEQIRKEAQICKEADRQEQIRKEEAQICIEEAERQFQRRKEESELRMRKAYIEHKRKMEDLEIRWRSKQTVGLDQNMEVKEFTSFFTSDTTQTSRKENIENSLLNLSGDTVSQVAISALDKDTSSLVDVPTLGLEQSNEVEELKNSSTSRTSQALPKDKPKESLENILLKVSGDTESQVDTSVLEIGNVNIVALQKQDTRLVQLFRLADELTYSENVDWDGARDLKDQYSIQDDVICYKSYDRGWKKEGHSKKW
jgi:hypothetical protein